MQFRGTLILMIALAAGVALTGARLARETPTEAQAVRLAAHNATAYTLPPAKLKKAVTLNRTGRALEIAGDVWTPIVLVLILGFGMAARIRDVANRLWRNRWAQGFTFTFLLLLLVFLLDLPLSIYGHHVGLSYGLSVEGWSSWLADKGKIFALEWGIGGLLVMLISRIIGKSPTRWWFWFWIPAAACVVAGVFVSPYVIEPMFYKFEPLAQTDPALVQRLEQVVARSGISIPPDRMFLMKASAKSTEINAYVSGFGASKRVVVWDTTIAKATPDEIAFIFAHEMGHYALGHVAIGTALGCAMMLPGFWLAYLGTGFLLRRFGARWRIPSQHDWAALTVLALVLLVLSALSDPLSNGISRCIEHDADVYGQEAMHGIVADPQALGQHTFQVLGEDSLDDPTPHPLFDWWFDTHPTTRFRAAFAEAYDPWTPGAQPKYFAK